LLATIRNCLTEQQYCGSTGPTWHAWRSAAADAALYEVRILLMYDVISAAVWVWEDHNQVEHEDVFLCGVRKTHCNVVLRLHLF